MDHAEPSRGNAAVAGAASQASLRSQATQPGIPKCHPANRAFYERLLELKAAADGTGRSRQARSYLRVLRSLKRYPLPLQSAHDAAGLEGVGKAVMGIFQEVLDDAADRREATDAHEDIAWAAACRRRLARELKAQRLGQDRGGQHASTQQRWGKRRITKASQERRRDQHQQQQPQEGAAAADTREAAAPQEPAAAACSSEKSPSPARCPPACLSLVPQSQSASASQRLQQPGTPAAASRLSLAATCRRAAARVNPPAAGSSAWCVLVSLGLYCSDAHDKALAQVEIERCISQQLRPQLPRCDQIRKWTAVVGRLQSRGLIEELAVTGRYRLTDKGSAMAGELVRKLEVPLSALSPLRVGASAPDPEVADTLVHKDSQSDDDKPLLMLAASAASPQRRRCQLKEPPICEPVPLADIAVSPHTERVETVEVVASPADAAPSPQQQPQLGDAVPLPAPTSSASSSVFAASSAGADLAAYAFNANRAQEPVVPAPKRRRALKVSQSAPDITPARLPPKRKLVPTYSAPDVVVPRKIRHIDRPQLVLLLDHREVGAGREHAARGALLADLASQLGEESVEARSLPLGDMLWVWRLPHTVLGSGAQSLASLLAREDPVDTAPQELIAGWVVERKTFHDLSASIMDGRYDEQKSRLLEAPGLDGVLYLVEGSGSLFGVNEQDAKAAPAPGRGFGQRLVGRSLPTSTLSTTAVHTQFISGFHVAHSTSTPHTVLLLVALHEALAERGPPSVSSEPEAGVSAPVSYRDFAECTRKSCHSRVFEAFGKMLRVVPHCGPEATEALVDEFLTPNALAAALRDSSDKDLLLRLKARRGGRTAVTAAALAACRELFGT